MSQQHDNTPGQLMAELQEPVLTPSEVALLFRVDPKTVIRWAQKGQLPGVRIIRTPGGHRRFSEAGIRALLNGGQS